MYNIEQIANSLDAMPPKTHVTREKNSKYSAIKLMYPQIISLRKKGYTIEEICGILNQNGLNIAVTTFNNYLSRIKKSGDGINVVINSEISKDDDTKYRKNNLIVNADNASFDIHPDTVKI